VPHDRDRLLGLQRSIEPQHDPVPVVLVHPDPILKSVEKIAAYRDVLLIARIDERPEMNAVRLRIDESEIRQRQAGNIMILHPRPQIDEALAPIEIGITQEPPAVRRPPHREIDEREKARADPERFRGQQHQKRITQIGKKRTSLGFHRPIDRPDSRDQHDRQRKHRQQIARADVQIAQSNHA